MESPRDKRGGDTATAEYVSVLEMVSRFYEQEPRIRARVEVAALSHPGKVRDHNEDQYLAVRRYRGREILVTSLPEGLVEPGEDHAYTLAVADGMGGHRFGEIASLLALLTGWELGRSEIKWSMKMNEREVDDLRRKAEAFFLAIDRTLHAEVRENPRLAGMGTTLTLCYSTGPELFVMHVGDSRAYLYRDGMLRQLTRDHTVAQMLVDAGVAEAGSPEALRVRHVLTNCLGGPDVTVTVDFDHHRLADRDLVLVCTDGLTDMVGDAEIAQLLGRHSAPSEACNALLERALALGGNDNITLLLARYCLEESRGDELEFTVARPEGETA